MMKPLYDYTTPEPFLMLQVLTILMQKMGVSEKKTETNVKGGGIGCWH